VAIIAWDCADEAYREHAYKCMAIDIARLREALRLARADLVEAVAQIDRELSFVDPALLMDRAPQVTNGERA
jgi:hypothetical protein